MILAADVADQPAEKYVSRASSRLLYCLFIGRANITTLKLNVALPVIQFIEWQDDDIIDYIIFITYLLLFFYLVCIFLQLATMHKICQYCLKPMYGYMVICFIFIF